MRSTVQQYISFFSDELGYKTSMSSLKHCCHYSCFSLCCPDAPDHHSAASFVALSAVLHYKPSSEPVSTSQPPFRRRVTAPRGRGTSGTSASWTCPPLARAGSAAPGWTGNVWRGRWCSRVGRRRICPRRRTPGPRAAGPWPASRRTPGAPRCGGPGRPRSPGTGSCRGRRWTWPLSGGGDVTWLPGEDFFSAGQDHWPNIKMDKAIAFACKLVAIAYFEIVRFHI